MGKREGGGASTLARQWAMLRCIPRHPQRITVAELKSRLADRGFAVTSRTVERDLHSLSDTFPLLVDDRCKPFGWSWAPGAAFEFAPGLTPAQAVSLLLGRTHLSSLLPRSVHGELIPLYALAEAALADSGWRDWHLRTAVLPTSVRLLPPKLDLASTATVHSALGRRRCLEGFYRSKGATSARAVVIHPLGLLVRGSVLYLACTLFEYVDVRHLAVHRLTGLRELDQTCREPEGFCLQTHLRESGSMYRPEGLIRLVVRFEPRAAEHLFETPLAVGQTLRRLPDGRVEATAEVECDQTLRWWLLGFGSQAEVIEPASLRNELAREVRAAAFAYESRVAEPGDGPPVLRTEAEPA